MYRTFLTEFTNECVRHLCADDVDEKASLLFVHTLFTRFATSDRTTTVNGLSFESIVPHVDSALFNEPRRHLENDAFRQMLYDRLIDTDSEDEADLVLAIFEHSYTCKQLWHMFAKVRSKTALMRICRKLHSNRLSKR